MATQQQTLSRQRLAPNGMQSASTLSLWMTLLLRQSKQPSPQSWTISWTDWLLWSRRYLNWQPAYQVGSLPIRAGCGLRSQPPDFPPPDPDWDFPGSFSSNDDGRARGGRPGRRSQPRIFSARWAGSKRVRYLDTSVFSLPSHIRTTDFFSVRDANQSSGDL